MTIDGAYLDEKLADVEAARKWSPRVVAKLESLLREGSDDALARINPIAFAAERGIAEDEAIDLFLHAAKAGLLQLGWYLLCPMCGSAMESFLALRQVGSRCHCALCHTEADVQLDDLIQVAFTVSPRVRSIAQHAPETLSARDYYFRYRFTREARFADGGPRFVDGIATVVAATEWVGRGERRTLTVQAGAGVLSAADMHGRRDFALPVSEDASASAVPVRITVMDGSVQVGADAVRPGTVTLEIENRSSSRAAMILLSIPQAALETDKVLLEFDRFLTGARLLASQTFRRLFRMEVLQHDEGLGVRDVTLLFTDLKGSTELYERVGDLEAYALVRAHFDRLAAAIQTNGGAVVKTIGDAVMAVFCEPARAVRAALDMQAAIDAFNRESGSREMVLKIGIHRGASIAVNLNENLDYFGRTVNVAARVQAEAAADEICLTEDVYAADGVASALEGRDVRVERARLKGIGQEVALYRVGRRTPASAAA